MLYYKKILKDACMNRAELYNKIATFSAPIIGAIAIISIIGIINIIIPSGDIF